MPKVSGPERIAVFGYKDSLVGQLLGFLQQSSITTIACFISIHDLPVINEEREHSTRPNRKTAFVRNGLLYGLPVFVTRDYVPLLLSQRVTGALVLEDGPSDRMEIMGTLRQAGISLAPFIHPTVFLGGENSIGEGAVIFPHCHIGWKADIGEGTILQAGCQIEHHNAVGQYCNINPRLTTGGFTSIGNRVEIGMCVDIINRVTVEDDVRIGAGSLVLKDCQRGFLYYGRPAARVRVNE